MNQSFSRKKEIIDFFISKKPEYEHILSFYGKICELQYGTTPRLYVKLPAVEKNVMNMGEKEGFPLLSREQFVIDIPSSAALFEAICNTAKLANEKMKTAVEALEDAFSINALRREELLRRYADEAYLDSVTRDFGLDKTILKFLIHAAIYPSLRANAEMLKDQTDVRQWLRGYCPICGSSPYIGQFAAEGQRSYLCSFCGFEWPGERLKCPFCENADHTSLHYFYEEGDEAHRMDVCDNCKSYIKTVDSRKLNYEPDLQAEDIVTIHLDIIASEKGYRRPAPSPWGI